MKKKGYALIELIAVMAILSILLGCGFKMINTLNKIKKEVELEDAVYRVHSLLSYARSNCRKNFIEGIVIIDEVNNSISFQYRINNNDIIERTEIFSNNIKVRKNIGESKISVSDKGYLNTAGSIDIESGKRKYKITISVGIDDINIKEVQ